MVDKCDMEEFGTPDSGKKTIAILGDRRWPQAVKQEGREVDKKSYATYGSNVMSAQL